MATSGFSELTQLFLTPCGFMSPPLLGNCTAYWQLALMNQQEFPEGNALLTSIITISSCRASGSVKGTHPPVRAGSSTAKAAPSHQSSPLSQATVWGTQETAIWKPIESIHFKCSNFCSPATWVVDPQQITNSHLSVQCDPCLFQVSLMPTSA